MSTAGTRSGPWLVLAGRVPPPKHRVRKPVGMFGIRSLRNGHQPAITLSSSPPFFCPPKNNHTTAYKHRNLCDINLGCCEVHITTIRGEEAYRFSIINPGIQDLACTRRSSFFVTDQLPPPYIFCDAFSTLPTPTRATKALALVRGAGYVSAGRLCGGVHACSCELGSATA